MTKILLSCASVSKSMKFAVVLACVIAGAMADDPSFDDCGGSTSVMKVVAAGTEPAAVQKAMDFNITWTGDLPAAVTGGNVHQKMWEKVLGAWIPAPHTFDHDICELNACPLAPGNQTLKIHTNMPSIVPSGDYKVQLSFADSNSKAISCADVYYTV